MKKIAIILVALLFVLLRPVTRAEAATAEVDPFNICGTNASDCHVHYDIPTSQIPLSQTDTAFWSFFPEGEQRNAVMNWASRVWPDGDYHISTDKLEIYGDQIQRASDLDLNPAYFQDTEKHDENPKKAYTTARLCVTNPETGGLAGNFITEQLYKTEDDIPGMRDMTEGNRRLSSFTTQYVQLTQDYNLADLVVKIDQPPPCGANFTGVELQQKGVKSVLHLL